MSKMEALQKTLQKEQKEHKKTKAELSESNDRIQQQERTIIDLENTINTLVTEREHMGVATITSMLSADIHAQRADEANTRADEAITRAALAEGVTKHSQQITNVENQIAVLTKQNEQLKLQNDAWRKANEVLELKNKGLELKISTLEQRIVDLTKANLTLEKRVSVLETSIRTLQTDSSAQKDSFTTRDAMRDLEFFICRDACLASKISLAKMKKGKLYCFQNLKDAQPPVPLPAWLQQGDINLCAHIKDFKDNATFVVHVRPLTEAAVQETIAEDDDDAEDTAAKNLMMSKLRQYYKTEGTAFGVEPKKR